MGLECVDVDVRRACNRLWDILQEQGGGCVGGEDGQTEVFPFAHLIGPATQVEVLRPGATVREVRGAVWRLSRHDQPPLGVWCLRDAEALHIGVLTDNPLSVTEPVHSLEGLTHG